MLSPLENLLVRSKDIWDYLSDMPYMPSREDRDDLVKNAEADPLKMKRVQLWDYFFRIHPDDVAKPQKQELVALEVKVAKARENVKIQVKKLEGEHTKLTNARDQLEAETQQYAIDQVKKIEQDRAKLISDREKLEAETQQSVSDQVKKLDEERVKLTSDRDKLDAEAQQYISDQVKELEDEHAKLINKLEIVQAEFEQYQRSGAKDRALAQLIKSNKRKRIFGVFAAVIALFIGIPFFICGMLLFSNEDPISSLLLLGFGCLMGLPLVILSILLFTGSGKPSPAKISQKTTIFIDNMRRRTYEPQVKRLSDNIEQITLKIETIQSGQNTESSKYTTRIAQISDNIEQIPSRLEAIRSVQDANFTKYATRTSEISQKIQQTSALIQSIPIEFETSYLQYEQRIHFLKTEISNLLEQIPPIVSDEQVLTWLKEDVDELGGIAEDNSGLRGRLIPVLSGTNPFCIRGPAELQKDELIPEPFRKKGSDRHKHLKARNVVDEMPDGSFVDFYGVYNIEFILVAEDVFASYGTFYDFIRGLPSGERTTVQHYIDVVTIKAVKGYREVEIDEGKKIFMENVPSLSLSLMDGEKIDVTFPDEDYFQKINALGFSSDRWQYDPRKVADNAIKTVREKVNIAKRKRERGTNT